jgi:hypothetical protein
VVSEKGGADHTLIGEAIRYAKPYDRILIQAGTYDESLYIDKPLTLVGSGLATDVILNSATSHCLKIVSDGVRIRNISIHSLAENTDRPAVSIGRGNAQFDDCDITSRSRLCISVRGLSAAPVFRNCRIRNSPGVGIHFAMNSTGKLKDCYVYGHKKAALRLDGGANPDITGGSLQGAILRSRGGIPNKNNGRSTNSNFFADSIWDASMGVIAGGLIGLTSGLLVDFLGIKIEISLIGIGVGVILGFAKARMFGLILGGLASLALLPVALPESVSRTLLGQLQQFGIPGIDTAAKLLDLTLKGGVIGAVTLVFCGAYLIWWRGQE